MSTADAAMTCDLVVAGSGAGGLATAVTAAWLGLDVIVVEKDRHLGGTTAWSGGWMWVPRNPLAVAAGIVEGADAPRRYLISELGERFDAKLVDRYLEQAPRMVSFFSANTRVAFVDGNAIADFHVSPGAGKARSVCAAPFDGRELGRRIDDLRAPLGLVSPFGMGIASGADIGHFINSRSNAASFVHVARRVLQHWLEQARYGRGMRLVNGNALIARLLKSADELKVRILTSTPARQIMRENGRVTGLLVEQEGRPISIEARRGVVMACGGFPHDTKRMAKLFAHAPSGREHWSAAPNTNDGDGLRLGEDAGGSVASTLVDAAAWCPVSLVPDGKGGVGHFPHLVERAKPGAMMVLASGRRFANEADAYHDVMRALFKATPAGSAPECWIICDARFIARYGLGRVRPPPFPKWPWLRNGYLKKGRTIEALAQACGIDGVALRETVAAYNEAAREGLDPEFRKGETPYNRIQGEAKQQPNPCVRPVDGGPYYGVKIVAGSLGTFAGLKTDEAARVLDRDGAPIAGLYAVGNDMASMMGGNYPAGGITLGPAMTFGYIAAHDAAGVPLVNNRTETP